MAFNQGVTLPDFLSNLLRKHNVEPIFKVSVRRREHRLALILVTFAEFYVVYDISHQKGRRGEDLVLLPSFTHTGRV